MRTIFRASWTYRKSSETFRSDREANTCGDANFSRQRRNYLQQPSGRVRENTSTSSSSSKQLLASYRTSLPPPALSLSLLPRRLCQFPTIPRRRSAKLCYFGLHEELCASYAPQWDYVADDLLLRESSVPSGPACPVTLMDLSPFHFRFNILINFPRILEVAIDDSCDLDGGKF